MNWDVLVSNRHKVETSRWYWDRDYYESEVVNKFRLDIDSEDLDLGRVPKETWAAYWDRKMKLIDESTDAFGDMLEDIDTIKTVQVFACPKCNKDLGNAYNLRIHSGSCKGLDNKTKKAMR